MSKISELIFKGAAHTMSSPYGKRNVIKTSAGTTNPFHYGTDYSTGGKKLPQYAIEDGTILSAGKASDGALYCWVKYPRINKKFLHYHLDTVSVKAGQAVKKGTLIGTTGKSGKATGIHLHLGIKDVKTDTYEDPEAYAKKYTEPTAAPKYSKGTYTVNTELLRVRKGAGTSYAYLKFNELTANAQAQVKKLNKNKSADGLVKGCECTIKEVKNTNWGKCPSGWICLDYCKKV